MPIPPEVAGRIDQWFDPGPPPTEHDDTGAVYRHHDVLERAAALRPALVAALESSLGSEVAVDVALHRAYNDETLRPWEQVVAVVRTATAVHLTIVHSRQPPLTLRCAPGSLNVRRTKNIWKKEVELKQENGVATVVLGSGIFMKEAQQRLEAMASPPPVAAAPPPPGWYPDPARRRRVRWWDGTAWTAHAADEAAIVLDPL